MEKQIIETLGSLHTHAIDARNGYQEALKDAEGQGLTNLFTDMIALHTRNADELAAALMSAGGKVEDDGSFMSVVHKTIMDIRSLFGGLGASVIPGLIDGETRNMKAYDKAIADDPLPDHTQALLTTQKARLASAIVAMRAQIV